MKSVSIVVGMISVGAVLVIGASGCSADPSSSENESDQTVKDVPAIQDPVVQQQDTCEQWGWQCPTNPSICKTYFVPPSCGGSYSQAMQACQTACGRACTNVEGGCI